MSEEKRNVKKRDEFYQYMLFLLERSIEYSHRMKQRSFNSVQLFVTLITALTGGTVLLATK